MRERVLQFFAVVLDGLSLRGQMKELRPRRTQFCGEFQDGVVGDSRNALSFCLAQYSVPVPATERSRKGQWSIKKQISDEASENVILHDVDDGRGKRQNGGIEARKGKHRGG